MTSNSDRSAHRVITFLNRDEVDFLDKIGKDALFSTGTKLSRSKVISAVVNVIRKLEIEGYGVKSRKELEKKILNAIKNLQNKMNQHFSGNNSSDSFGEEQSAKDS